MTNNEINLKVPEEKQLLEQVQNSNIPDNFKQIILRTFSKKEFHFEGMFPIQNPMLEKINEEHITDIIKNGEASDKRDYEIITREKTFNFILAIAILIFVLLLCFIFRDNIQSVMSIIIPMITFVGGYGYGYRKAKDE